MEQNRVERMDRIRRVLVTAAVVTLAAYILWAITSGLILEVAAGGLQNLADQSLSIVDVERQGALRHQIDTLSAVMNVVQAALLVGIVALGSAWVWFRGRLRADADLRIAVDDERIRESWLRSYRFAFWCLGIWFGLGLAVQWTMFAVQTAWIASRRPQNLSPVIMHTWRMVGRFDIGFLLGLTGLFAAFLRNSEDR